MARWSKYLFFTLLFLVVGYLLAVQVLRWMAYGDEEQAAVALMRDLPPPPAGDSGFKYLAYADKDAPDEALDAALAADVAAFADYHARYAERLAGGTDAALEPAATPGADSLPNLPAVPAPDFACSFSQEDCLARLRGHEAAARAWLDAAAPRTRRVEQALASSHLANPYALNAAMPFPGYQQLRLPINEIAMQALEGNVAGALPRACYLLADARKHLRNDGLLIDKVVFAALTQGASDLLLRVRRLDPALPLPDDCAAAIAPVDVDDFQVCNALRGEFAMMSELSRQMDEANHGWRTPTRWVLTSHRLQDGWMATGLAPFCTAEGQAAIARGDIPKARARDYDRASLDFWAAPISHTLASISSPAYGGYQQRLLDHAQALRTNLEAITRVEPPAQEPSAAE
ncbi:hypothetical protein [Arenimonas donghaensis]|uniref:Uncharacterized protein n=1 Tax=Arenimonas donghaensis DSM 18148 = HO3-R19 TaxID=1121014 RepID=A0A087MH56_9GAMM|nr:hypothetical protein [Arenimonas donghaensis]KFL36209.1 hypothetical protein N788_04795 [Arenimonas donghaensis DSM 18148 = HO3-R19]